MKAAQIVAEWDPFASPILTEVGGVVQYGDLVEGVTVIEKVDEVTGLSRKISDREPRGEISARASRSSTRRRASR